MSRHEVLRRGFVVAVAVLLGLLTDQLLPRASVSAPTALSSLAGRHLQPPWWESVIIHEKSPGSISYTVPADVLFGTNSFVLTPAGQSALRALVPELTRATSITIAGCTDSVGGADSPSNIVLSERRAEAAKGILVGSRLDPALFHILAWADTHPVADVGGLDPATVDALNRRIVIMVTRRA